MREQKQATCFICYNPVYAHSVYDVHCLWDDEEYSGRPICEHCYFFLNNIIPEKIDVPIKRGSTTTYKGIQLIKKTPYNPKKIGLEKWI